MMKFSFATYHKEFPRLFRFFKLQHDASPAA